VTLKEEVDLLKEQVRLLKAKEKLLLAIKELEEVQKVMPYVPYSPWIPYNPWPGSVPTITWEVGAGDPLPPLPVTTCSVGYRELANVPMTFTN